MRNIEYNWFQTVKEICPWYDRIDSRTIQVSFLGYKTLDYLEGCKALTELGAFQLTCDYDEHSGRTFARFIEPKAVQMSRTKVA